MSLKYSALILLIGVGVGYYLAPRASAHKYSTASQNTTPAAHTKTSAIVTAVPNETSPVEDLAKRSPASESSSLSKSAKNTFWSLPFAEQMNLCDRTVAQLDKLLYSIYDKEPPLNHLLKESQAAADRSLYWYAEHSFSPTYKLGLLITYSNPDSMENMNRQHYEETKKQELPFYLCYWMSIGVVGKKDGFIQGFRRCGDTFTAIQGVPYIYYMMIDRNVFVNGLAIPVPPHSDFHFINAKTGTWEKTTLNWISVSESDLPKYKKFVGEEVN